MAPVITTLLDLNFTAESLDPQTHGFLYTSFSKIQREDDSVYFGKIEKPRENISFEEFTEELTRIPDEEIYPKFPTDGSIRSFFEPIKHLYLKRPRLFCYEEYKDDNSVHVIPTLLIEEGKTTPKRPTHVAGYMIKE
ncbi:hypothetical protein N7456_013422 [Penicillium angulare]|uniref:Uncharacterized protein n=1 Tax=Penicillium angulare TaxID=116970 RepID=A0A9W9EG84_9EURO|nr:hypothetical protein N7456_013422 [Penicillium angulare]